MSSAASLGTTAVGLANAGRYLRLTPEQAQVFRKPGHDPLPSRSGGGCSSGSGNCDPFGFGLIALVVAIFSGIIGTTAASKYANNSRIEANAFQAKELEAREKQNTATTDSERSVLADSEKIFGSMATERRVACVGQALMATGFAVLTAVALAAIGFHYHPLSHSDEFLKYGALGGAAFLAGGILTYCASQGYAKVMQKELEEAAARIQTNISACRSL